jgi:hypothetical protein
MSVAIFRDYDKASLDRQYDNGLKVGADWLKAQRARAIWDELGLPALTPRQPWHGYSLGDWDAVWDTYAERAVHGQWEETGKETFAQRRGGLTPETPVKSVKE